MGLVGKTQACFQVLFERRATTGAGEKPASPFVPSTALHL